MFWTLLFWQLLYQIRYQKLMSDCKSAYRNPPLPESKFGQTCFTNQKTGTSSRRWWLEIGHACIEKKRNELCEESMLFLGIVKETDAYRPNISNKFHFEWVYSKRATGRECSSKNVGIFWNKVPKLVLFVFPKTVARRFFKHPLYSSVNILFCASSKRSQIDATGNRSVSTQTW